MSNLDEIFVRLSDIVNLLVEAMGIHLINEERVKEEDFEKENWGALCVLKLLLEKISSDAIDKYEVTESNEMICPSTTIH